MIVLGTNVLSALMRAQPEPAVVAWLDRQPAEAIWTTSITLFEVRMGIALLPVGRRRERLELAFRLTLAEDLAGRVLPFDEAAANGGGTRGTCATRRSPASCSPVEPASPRATRAISRTSTSSWSIPGSRPERSHRRQPSGRPASRKPSRRCASSSGRRR